jgi:hypothetical protein
MSLSVLTCIIVLLSQYCCMTTSFSPFQSWVGLLHSKPLHSSSIKQDSSALSNVSMKYPLLNDLIIRAARGEVVERTPVKNSLPFRLHSLAIYHQPMIRTKLLSLSIHYITVTVHDIHYMTYTSYMLYAFMKGLDI